MTFTLSDQKSWTFSAECNSQFKHYVSGLRFADNSNNSICGLNEPQYRLELIDVTGLIVVKIQNIPTGLYNNFCQQRERGTPWSDNEAVALYHAHIVARLPLFRNDENCKRLSPISLSGAYLTIRLLSVRGRKPKLG